MILPDRWTPLKYHPIQHRLWNEGKRFAVVPAGRRSGKTELAKRKVVNALFHRQGEYNDARFFCAAPTYGQAKRIYWKDLLALTPPEIISDINKTDLIITTVYGSELHVIGMDKPQRIEGTPWDFGILDEYGNMKPEVWGENVRPALSDRKGGCWLIGVPEGYNHYKELADEAMSGKDSDFGYYTWPSADILDEDEVEAARRHLDSRTFRQEYMASFESASGQVYYAYDQKVHEDADIKYNPKKDIILSVDFNVDPCVWELAQFNSHKGERTVQFFDEICLKNTNTIEMCKETLRRYPEARFIVYGDAAGSARQTAGASDYAIMRDLGIKNQSNVPRSNPAVKDRVNAVNGMLMSATGIVRLTHSPKCTMLKKDFQNICWKDNGEIDKSDGDRTHASDAGGYLVEAEFGYNKFIKSGKKFYK